MTDPLSITSSIISLLQLIAQGFKYALDIQYDSLSRCYGPFVALLVSTFLPDTAKQYERVERVVLQGKPEDALAFRQAVTDECNMTAVAVGRSPRDRSDIL